MFNIDYVLNGEYILSSTPRFVSTAHSKRLSSEKFLKEIRSKLDTIKVLLILAICLSFTLIPSLIFLGIIILVYLELEDIWQDYIYTNFIIEKTPPYAIANNLSMTVEEVLNLYVRTLIRNGYPEVENDRKVENNWIKAGGIMFFIIPVFWVGIILVCFGLFYYRPKRYDYENSIVRHLLTSPQLDSFLQDSGLTKEQLQISLGYPMPKVHINPIKAQFQGIFTPSGDVARREPIKPVFKARNEKQDLNAYRRLKKLEQISKRSQQMKLQQLAFQLDFDNLFKAERWLLSLPEKYRLTILNGIVYFGKEEMHKRPSTTRKTAYSPRTDTLTAKQKEIITDLQNGKALPLTQISSAFNIEWFDIVRKISPYLPQSYYLTRINDLYRIVEPAPTCQLSKALIEDVPYFQCESCGRHLSKEHYADIEQLGYAVCPNCGGSFRALPIKCSGCGVAYLDLGDMKNFENCQFCNYKLEYFDITHLDASMSAKEIEHIKTDLTELKSYSYTDAKGRPYTPKDDD